MPRHKPKAHELTTEEAARKLFPQKVREVVQQEAQKALKTKEKPVTKS